MANTNRNSVCIVSIVRLVTLVSVDLKSLDLYWNFAQVGIWTATESNIAIVSGKDLLIPSAYIR